MKKCFVVFLFFCSVVSKAEWLVELELGLQLGQQNEITKNFFHGLQAGIFAGHKFQDFSVGAEFRYLNLQISPIETQPHDQLHVFPIGFAFRYDLPQIKLRPEFAYYFDCAAYRGLSLIPVTYMRAFEGYGSWRMGANYLLDNNSSVGLFYELQVYKSYKIRQPTITTGDVFPEKRLDFFSITMSKSY